MIRFGTDGIRGRAGDLPCTPEVGVAIGRAAVRFAREQGEPRVILARDPRPSGEMLEAAVAAGIAGEGGHGLLAGVLPTSGCACALASGLGTVGIMLTASHNPWQDNGFKVLGPGGRKLTDEENARIEAWLGEPGSAAPGDLHSAHEEAWDCYVSALDDATPERQELKGRKLAIDLANGAAVSVLEWLVESVPADIVFVGEGGGRPNDGVGTEHPEGLVAAVRASGCAAGIAVDGDGDRCRLVDETGALVDGDALAWLLARGRAARAMAVTVMSTTALEASLPGVRIVRTAVGDRHLAEAMRDPEMALGCEESGHVLFRDALPIGDGLVTGLRALAIAFREGSVSAAVRGFTPFPRRVAKVPVRVRPPLDEVPALVEAQREGEAALGPHGRVFLRYSGTEPILRVLVEGPDAEVVARVGAEVTRVATAVLA